MTTDAINALDATNDIWQQTTFGSLVRALRMSDDISQVELAKKLGVTKQFLSNVEHDRKTVGFEFAKKVSAALQYSIEPMLELLIRQQLNKQQLYYSVELKPLQQ